MGITVELRMDGTLLASQDISPNDFQDMLKGDFDVHFGVSNDFVLEVEEEFTLDFEEEEEEDDYNEIFDILRDDFTDSEGNRFHVNMRQHPLGYCEECGAFVGDEPFSEKRGAVFEPRITRDPVYIPLYHFCSQECEDHFFEHSMRARYGSDKAPKLEIRLVHDNLNKYARLFVNGIEVYTLEGYDLEHRDRNEVPRLVLRLPLRDYIIDSSVLGPGNIQ